MKKKIKKYLVGLNSETYAISLVEAPAIEETLVALEEQKPIKVQLADEEKYMVYSAVLVPDKPIYRRNEDGDEYYIEFSKESIEKMSQDYLMNYRQNEITLDHQTMANDITLVETWIKTDMYKDKSVAIGLSEDLPIGTWIAGLKVNQIDVWNRIKNGELKGFSVESMISLEEFENQNKDNMNIDTNEMFWDKLKNVLKEAFGKAEKKEGGDNIEPIDITDMEAQEQPTEQPIETVTEPQPTDAPTEGETTVTEPKNGVVEEPKVDEQPRDDQGRFAPKNDENVKHLEEIIASMKEEVEALKSLNSGLTDKIKALEKEPSTKPISIHSSRGGDDKGVYSSAYQNWRDVMRGMM